MATALVTGTNRGIGLELCTRLAKRGDTVYATCRKPSSELSALGVNVLSGIDVSDPGASGALREAVGDDRLDLVIQNAGILERVSLDSLDFDSMRRQFEVNALAPLRLTEALLPNLASGAKVALITSLMGSMGDNGSGGSYGYRMSKAALNAAGVSLARDLAPKGIAVFLLHPGMVATEMTGRRGISVEESATGLLERIATLGMSETGTFWHADGRSLPW